MHEFLISNLREALQDSEQECTEDMLETLAENIMQNEDEYQSTLAWIMAKQAACGARVESIGLGKVLGEDWFVDRSSGNIEHKSGGFFKVLGVDVKTDTRESGRGWKQPMLDQGTESSIAGFLCKRTEEGRKYLVEAKFEPGNYGRVLISPSLQVTYSNLERAHGGRKPRFAEYFDGSDNNVDCIYSQWLPEDGGRFYLKRVKYMIVVLPDVAHVQIDDNFRWVGVNTLKRLLRLDDLVNPHVRSLLAVL